MDRTTNKVMKLFFEATQNEKILYTVINIIVLIK